VGEAADVLRALTQTHTADPQAAALRKLAAALWPYVEAYQRPARSHKHPVQTETRQPAAPSGTAEGERAAGRAEEMGRIIEYESNNHPPSSGTRVPAEHCILEGLTARTPAGDTVHSVAIVVHLPWASFAANIKLKVISNDGRVLLLELADDWYVPRMRVASHKGVRFTLPVDHLGHCGTVYGTVQP
jgi:hypothetical protein